MHTLVPLSILLSLPPAQAQDTDDKPVELGVSIRGSTFKTLLPPDPDADDEPDEPPRAYVISRDVQLSVVEEGWIKVVATWRVDRGKNSWFDARLAGANVRVSRVTWNGAETTVAATDRGVTVTGEVTGPTTIRLEGEFEGRPTEGLVFAELLQAPLGTVRVQAPGQQVPVVHGASGPAIRGREAFLMGGTRLGLRLDKPVAKRQRETLAVANVGMGLTVGDAEVTGRARIDWQVHQGELAMVSFSARGTGADLNVSGDGIADWQRSGDRVVVQLSRPERGRVRLDLSWTGSVPAGAEASLGLPSITPEGAWRTATSLQLARDGDVEVVPQLDSWEPITAGDLPEWGEGLVVGTPTATFSASRAAPGGSLSLLRFTPVSGPPVVIDIASYDAATTRDGHVLMRAHYAVRNDRGAHLRVIPPEGLHIVGVRVMGETSLPVTDGREGWLVPLQRSVETVEGLLSVPVEVVFLGEQQPWDKKEKRRPFELPRVDADIAVSRVSLHLPPDYENRLEEGKAGDYVASFTEGEGITYGFSVGDTKAAQADALFQDAVRAWMSNEFDDAQHALETLTELGASNENIRKLQSNIDLVQGKDTGGKMDADKDTALSRRVKEQARARSVDEERKREEVLREAEELEMRGDYAQAEQQYRQAYEIGEKLKNLEQKESVEVSSSNVAISSKLESVAKKSAQKKKAEVEYKAEVFDEQEKAAEEWAAKQAAARQAAEGERRRAELARRTAQEASRDSGVQTEESRRGQVLTKETLDRIPTGRSYQSAVEMVPGVATSGKGKGEKKSDKVTITRSNIEVRERVHFGSRDAEVTGANEPVLDDVAQVLQDHPDITLQVDGHTAGAGGDAFNQDLSEQRAQSVRDELIARGVPPEQLVARGFGRDRPIDSNKTPSGSERNNRVEFTIVDTPPANAAVPAPPPPPMDAVTGFFEDVDGLPDATDLGFGPAEESGVGGLGVSGTGEGGGGIATGMGAGYGTLGTLDAGVEGAFGWSEGGAAGVAGGVVGGVVGGVAGGVLGGEVAEVTEEEDEEDSDAPPVKRPSASPEPAPEPDYEPRKVELLSVQSRRSRVRVPRVSIGLGKKKAKSYGAGAASQPTTSASPAPTVSMGAVDSVDDDADFDFSGEDIDGELIQPDGQLIDGRDVDRGEFDKPLDVTAAQLSVVIPAQGEVVRFQHLLLPAGAPYQVPLDARWSKKNTE